MATTQHGKPSREGQLQQVPCLKDRVIWEKTSVFHTQHTVHNTEQTRSKLAQASANIRRHYRVGTMSSIFKIIRTHSVASVRALDVTNSGCTTLSSSMSLMMPCIQESPHVRQMMTAASLHDQAPAVLCIHQQWMQPYLLDIEAGGLGTSSVQIAQLSHDSDWIETRVLSERVGDNLQGLSESAHTVSVHTLVGTSTEARVWHQIGT